MVQLAKEDARIFAITAAMEPGTGLGEFATRFPQQYFDVGIAEGHEVSMAAGMAKQGLLPIFAVYSTFLQRSYDMLLHDVGIEGLHVVLCVDRAGLVGEDGETHHGLFDLSFLASVPGMNILAPASGAELSSMLRHGVLELTGPVAIRYPRGGEGIYREDHTGQGSTCLQEGEDVTLVSYGTMVNTVLEVAEKLREKGMAAEVIKLNCLLP